MPTDGRAQGTQVAAGDARAPAPATAAHAPAQQRDGGTAMPILTARIAARDSVADPLRAVLQLASSLGLRGPLGDDERDAEGSGSPDGTGAAGQRAPASAADVGREAAHFF